MRKDKLVRDEGVAGSNPATPTTLLSDPERSADSFADRNRRYKRIGYVYFATDGEAIKIGFSLNAPRRMAQIRHDIGVPVTLIDYFLGSRAEEKRLHLKFSRLRTGRGREWFRPTPSLLSFIERAQSFKDEISMHFITLADVIAGNVGSDNMPKRITTAIAFRQWLEKHKAEMSPDLLHKAGRLGFALSLIDINRPAVHEQIAQICVAPAAADFAKAWADHRGLAAQS